MFGAGAVGPSGGAGKVVLADGVEAVLPRNLWCFCFFFLHFGKNRCDAPGQRLLNELRIPQTAHLHIQQN